MRSAANDDLYIHVTYIPNLPGNISIYLHIDIYRLGKIIKNDTLRRFNILLLTRIALHYAVSGYTTQLVNLQVNIALFTDFVYN